MRVPCLQQQLQVEVPCAFKGASVKSTVHSAHKADGTAQHGWWARGGADSQAEQTACAQDPQRLADMQRMTGALFGTQCCRHRTGG